MVKGARGVVALRDFHGKSFTRHGSRRLWSPCREPLNLRRIQGSDLLCQLHETSPGIHTGEYVISLLGLRSLTILTGNHAGTEACTLLAEGGIMGSNVPFLHKVCMWISNPLQQDLAVALRLAAFATAFARSLLTPRGPKSTASLLLPHTLEAQEAFPQQPESMPAFPRPKITL